MEAAKQVIKCKEFVEKYYMSELLANTAEGNMYLSIDFLKFSIFDPELAHLLLEKPEDIIKAGELAIEQFDLDRDGIIKLRFFNVPQKESVFIRNIRSKHLGKFIVIQGIVRQKSDVRPQIEKAKFECPSCGTMISLSQTEKTILEPKKCHSCGYKGKFTLVDKELSDMQGLVLEESTDVLEGGQQPKRLNILLKDDLVSPISEKKTNPGSNVRIYGIVKEIALESRTAGKNLTKYDIVLQANNIEALEEDYSNIKISKDEEKKIKELAADQRSFERLTKSLAPGIYGHERVKEAILLLFFGGVLKHRSDGVKNRGDTHILLIGDPGSGKSQLLKRAAVIAPKSKFVSGKGASLDYEEPILISEDNTVKIKKIGDVVEENITVNKDNALIPLKKDIKTVAFNPETYQLQWSKIEFGFKHRIKQKLVKLQLQTGRNVRITKNHSVFILKNGSVREISAEDLKKGNTVLIPNHIPKTSDAKIPKGIATILGYFIAEGHLYNKDGSYKIQFTLHKNEKKIIKIIDTISKDLWNKECKLSSHGKNSIRGTIYGKDAYMDFKKYLGSAFGKKAKTKKIPECIFNAPRKDKITFLSCYLKGDFGVTKSEDLISDILYLYLQLKKIRGFTQREDSLIKKIENRIIYSEGERFDLKSFNKPYSNRYENIPIDALSKEIRTRFCKTRIQNKSQRITWDKLTNKKTIGRILFIGEHKTIPNPKLTTKYKKNILPFIKLNKDIFSITKVGRTNTISLTKKGRTVFKELIELKKIENSDFGFTKIKHIEEVKSTNEYVYDVSVPGCENFVGGIGGILCHNTGAGLTASVVKDEFLGGWALEAGALPLANKGFAIIDELDKMSSDDTSAMHEALEQQSVSISKANIQATLRCETTVLAAANPKLGRFDPYEALAKQINLPPALINRFDLIFPFRDEPDEQKDEMLAKFVLGMHRNREVEAPEIETDLLRKYIMFARQRIHPVITENAITELKDFYVKMRNSNADSENKAIPISARQLEALVRLTEASAKSRLSDKATKRDARRAIELLQYCLQQVGVDTETGQFDIDQLTTGVTTRQRNKTVIIRELIKECEDTIGKTFPIEDLVKAAETKGISADEVDEAIEKLKRSGDIFSPKPEFISRI